MRQFPLFTFRYFVATRDIQPLELVVIDEPAVVGPATKTRPICLECLKPPDETNEGFCRECGFIICQDCEKNDRKFHVKAECEILASSGLNKEVKSIFYKNKHKHLHKIVRYRISV